MGVDLSEFEKFLIDEERYPLSSRVGINATPLLESVISPTGSLFLSHIDATPPEDKCNTINATPVRWSP